ncbi:MAG: hypothetical protein OIN87_07180, partial [Candidatus Methanoperedens sp.]|nr:hypothetical protein [Candidatus Methanoperedens sp.]
MNRNLVLLVIIALTITTISQTFSFIVGDHQFYESVQDKCIKCHGDIQIQLTTSDQHSNFSCVSCHVRSATNHTNKNPECRYCHSNQHFNDSLEAHPGFSSLGSDGCVACHSTYNAIVNYSRAEYIDYTIINTNGNWIISDFKTTGTLNLSYDAMRQGGKHNIKNVSCKDCHKDIFDAASSGGHAVVLSKNGTQASYHNNSNSTPEEWCRTCHNNNDSKIQPQQHSSRKTTCEDCHNSYNLTPHPGNFYTNIKTVPRLYRSLVCISCKSAGWLPTIAAINFKVHQEPYYDVSYMIIAPLNITDSSPATDPTTPVGQTQQFSITLNRFADVMWFNEGIEIFRVLSVISATYTGSSRTAGVYNITVKAGDTYGAASKSWNWTVINATGGGGGGGGGSGVGSGGGGGSGGGTSSSISGFVSDIFGSPLSGVLVQNGSYQNNTSESGYYSILNIPNGFYNFSYSKEGYDTGYFNFTAGGVVLENANVTIYDTTPPNSVTEPNFTTGNFFINNTWINPPDPDFNYTVFRDTNRSTLNIVNNSTNYLNLTYSPHYVQNITAQTGDNYSNENETLIWFNATIPNNIPLIDPIGNKTVNEGELLTFNVTTIDLDNDTIMYGTNATNGSLNETSGVFSWIPGYGDAGEYLLEFNASDGYGGLANESMYVTVNNTPLSILDFSPLSDPNTPSGTPQVFEVTLNRIADITWYNNGLEIFTILGVSSANYTNSVAGIGIYNISFIANDGFDMTSGNWSWNVTAGSAGGSEGIGGSGGSNNSVSGYVFDNFGTLLSDVIVQNNSYLNITSASGYYSITNISNGTYNFSYVKSGLDTGYFEFAFNGAIIINANKTLYDTSSPGSINNITMTTGNFYINNSWTTPVDADFNYTWFRYDNGTTLQNVSSSIDFLNLTWSPHYTQNISAQTVDYYSNVNETKIWFNTTIPNNDPVQTYIGNMTISENEWLNFTINASDADNDTIIYNTNATKGTFNTTTGNFSWFINYSDSGIYDWYFNS